jgi:hypothetical protein
LAWKQSLVLVTPKTVFRCHPIGFRTYGRLISSAQAQVGDPLMSLIHACQLCGATSFDYLTELQRHAQKLATRPAEWMPGNYRGTLERIVSLSLAKVLSGVNAFEISNTQEQATEISLARRLL